MKLTDHPTIRTSVAVDDFPVVVLPNVRDMSDKQNGDKAIP